MRCCGARSPGPPGVVGHLGVHERLDQYPHAFAQEVDVVAGLGLSDSSCTVVWPQPSLPPRTGLFAAWRFEDGRGGFLSRKTSPSVTCLSPAEVHRPG